MDWDGQSWKPEGPRPPSRPRPARSSRLTDWIATLPILLLSVAFVAPFVVANAASPTLTTSGVARPGADLAVVGGGFTPRDRIQLLWDGSTKGMPSAKADAAGSLQVTIVVPTSATPGSHTLAALARKGGATPVRSAALTVSSALPVVSTTVNVTTAEPADPGTSSAPSGTPGGDPAADPPATATPAATATATATAVAGSPSESAAPPATSAPGTPPPATSTPTAAPTAAPTATPTPDPTATAAPTVAPTAAPTPTPTPAPVGCGTLQTRINATPTGSVLDLTGCTFTTAGSISRAMTIRGGTIRPPAGSRGLLVTASDVTLDGVRIVGRQATTYNSDEVGLEVEGGGPGSPVRGLTVRNSTISTFGYGGMYLRYVADVRISGNTVTDGVYAGIMVLSGVGGTIDGNTVRRIGVVGAATMGNNAYGIALTRGGGSLTADPRSADLTVKGNLVEDVPTWHAYDTHGGARIVWTGNVSRGSRSGIFVTGASSPSGTVRSLDNDINGNTFYAPSGSIHYAITSVYSTGGYVRNNVTVGWPSGRELLTTSSGDAAATAVDLTVSGNDWR